MMEVKRKPKPLLFLLIILVIIFASIGTVFFLVAPVERGNQKEIEVTIPSGTNTSKIGKILKEKDLIHSEFLFKVYVKIKNIHSLKASTYVFSKNMSLDEIVETLEKGSTYNPDMIKLTFKEGLRITDYAQVIGEKTNHSAEEFLLEIQNQDYLKSLIPKYWFLTDDILNSNLYYALEGYLAPNTYHFDNKDVSLRDIIETMLNQMDKELTPYKEVMIQNPHYYLTMASIVELEGTNTENRKMIVGIFQNRLNSKMNLGSDVTTYYGLQVPMTSDLSTEQFSSVNAYNTRSNTMIGKMPAGPICSPGVSSIEASVSPTDNDYLFFVADKNGKIYYSKTNREHDQLVAEIKARGDWIW